MVCIFFWSLYFIDIIYLYIQPPDPNLLSLFFEAGVPPNIGDLLSLMAAAASVAWTTCLGAWWHQREAWNGIYKMGQYFVLDNQKCALKIWDILGIWEP